MEKETFGRRVDGKRRLSMSVPCKIAEGDNWDATSVSHVAWVFFQVVS